MKVVFSAKALREYQDLPHRIRTAADKQLDFLLKNITHPSLHAKKYDESQNIWQARVVDETGNIYGEWTEFGSNGNSADFTVSQTTDFHAEVNNTNVETNKETK